MNTLILILGFVKSWRHPSDQEEIVPVNDNEAIEMASLQEQAVENQEDNSGNP